MSDIPSFPRMRPLTLEDKALYDEMFGAYWPRISEYTFTNREQDLGVKGLRQAKESYHPCAMVKKYALRLKEAG